VAELEAYMRKPLPYLIAIGLLAFAGSLAAQQVCPGLSYVADTPEDELMQAVAGAETPQEQIAALDEFAKAHPESSFMPCVEEYYTIIYLKLNDYDKVIEHGEKGLSGEYKDVMLMLNTIKGYVGSGKVSERAFEIIAQAPEVIKAEANPPRPTNVGDDEWNKNMEGLAAQAADQTGYMVYAFFQLLPRVAEGSKRVEALDKFVNAYAEAESKYGGQVHFNYYVAYKMAGDAAKAAEHAEKAIAADPNNVAALTLVAYDYATSRTNLSKATEYATRALELIPSMPKPEAVPEEQFKIQQNHQLGMARLALGYVAFLQAEKTKRVAPAIQEFKAAADLLEGNPELQAQTLYYLAYAYETQYPANHRGAIDALQRAVTLQSSWQSPAQELLAKVKRAVGE